MDSEPTHALPPELVDKLIEADAWSKRPPGTDSVLHLWEWQAEGARLLKDVVEIIEESWSFGPGPLPKGTT